MHFSTQPFISKKSESRKILDRFETFPKNRNCLRKTWNSYFQPFKAKIEAQKTKEKLKIVFKSKALFRTC